MIVNVVIVKRSLKKKWSLTKAQVMSVMDDDPSEKSNMRNKFPLLVSFLKMEMKIVMR